MLAAVATGADPADPLSRLAVGDHPEPEVPAGWTTVTVRAASLNHHDVWTLRGVAAAGQRMPVVLGCDAAGVTEDGREVVVYPILADPGTEPDEDFGARNMSMLSERFDGTLAERVAVPTRCLVPKPPELTFEEAACLPTAWLTAYRMLFGHGVLAPGDTVLVQGAGGGVATACIALARAGGMRVWATSRFADKRERALTIGAHAVFEPGARLPEQVAAAMETVGEATWKHSMRAVRAGGAVVVSGATSGSEPSADLRRVFYRQIKVVGSAMGSLAEFRRLVAMCAASGVRPVIDTVLPLADAREGLGRVAGGDLFGKIVLTP